MAETSGFFNAEELVDGTYDREYVAEQWADYFKLFIGNGVFVSPTNQLKVRENSGLTVKVLPGWAWINGYWYYNDSNLTLNIPINATAQTRTDGIFIRWNSNTREITTIVGEGRTTVNRTSPYYELKIAEVTVATGATSITDAVITDTRGNDDVCGFVKSLMEVISTEDLFAQFQSEFSTWLTQSQNSYNAWIIQQEGSFETWRATQQSDFEDWFQHLHDELDENQAAHLQNEIDDIYQKLEQTAHPVTISVTTPPVKTIYNHGDTLDTTGIVVTALYSDNHTEDVTSQCTFSPANGATLSDTMTAINIFWVWTIASLNITYTTIQAITVNSVLSSISITTPPTKRNYTVGESLDLTGIVVTATYSSARTANVTSECTFTPPDGTTLDTDETIPLTASYTERGVTKTASINITVEPPYTLSSISITTPPTKVVYVTGDALNLSGIVVTALYSDNHTENVTSKCTFSPANGAILSQASSSFSVNISYTEKGVTKTAVQYVRVIAIVTWANGTDEQLAAMLEAHYAGGINIHDYWSVGDERVVHLNNMSLQIDGKAIDVVSNYDNYCPAQDATMVLMNEGGKTLANGKTCAFVVGEKNCLSDYNINSQTYSTTGGCMNSTATNTGGWKNCIRRRWCNEIYYNAIESGFKSLLKSFKNITGKGGGSSDVEETTDWVALAAEIEIRGSKFNSAPGEGTQFAYYENKANWIKSLNKNSNIFPYYWCRSPVTNSTEFCCVIQSSSTNPYVDRRSANSMTLGKPTIFCI